MTDLKPCPFCGDKPEFVGNLSIRVEHKPNDCILCGMRFDLGEWNTRHEPMLTVEEANKMTNKKTVTMWQPVIGANWGNLELFNQLETDERKKSHDPSLSEGNSAIKGWIKHEVELV